MCFEAEYFKLRILLSVVLLIARNVLSFSCPFFTRLRRRKYPPWYLTTSAYQIITMSGLFGSTSSTSTPTTGDLSKDVPVSNPPEDSVSEIAFSPAAEYLSASSWDGKVRIYEIDGSGNSQGKAMISHEGPVLSTCWSKVEFTTIRSNCYRLY